MNFKGIKKIIYTTTLLAAFAVAMSSCNRGIGCPSDFSVEQVVPNIVSSIFHIR
ncbi:MAG: hypothetical protein KDC53_13740 [Saprospiraceae bacterium]|nr:hypothetical protein [Saprospiraceae bacterium]